LQLEYNGTNATYNSPKSYVIKKPKVIFKGLTKNEFDLKIIDSENQRWEVPQSDPFPKDPHYHNEFELSRAEYELAYTSEPFSF
jgi:hypothetical protein